MELND
jgi:hypothetical protein